MGKLPRKRPLTGAPRTPLFVCATVLFSTGAIHAQSNLPEAPLPQPELRASLTELRHVIPQPANPGPGKRSDPDVKDATPDSADPFYLETAGGSAPFLSRSAGFANSLSADAVDPQTQGATPAGQPRSPQKITEPGFPPVSPRPVARPTDAPRQDPEIPSAPPSCLEQISVDVPPQISCEPGQDPFQRFVDAAYVHPLTPRQKATLAFRNTIDPFNLATIAFLSAVSTASDPHSAYGPGFPGFGRNVGVTFGETATSEFFGTFLIPSIAHQDPHYYRLPNASYERRILHSITQVVVGVSDYGTPMPNYSILINTAVSDAIANLYVPGREQGFGPFAARYSIALATDPISNLITEFLPDVARRVNVRVVLVRQVINEVARQNGGAPVE